MATRQQRKKRIRAQVDELMKDFSPYATQVGTGNPPQPTRPKNFPGSKKGSKNMGLRGQTQQTLGTKSLGLHGKNTKSQLSSRADDITNAAVVLDSNAIIDSTKGKYVKHLQQILKKRNLKIILTETSIGESTRILQCKPKKLMELLDKNFGDRFESVKTEINDVHTATALTVKHKKYDLHHSDSLILAIAIKTESALITNDTNLKACCKAENIQVIDHRKVKLDKQVKTKPVKKVKPIRKKSWTLEEVLE
jgi:predicted nucleic acid-binding protein